MRRPTARCSCGRGRRTISRCRSRRARRRWRGDEARRGSSESDLKDAKQLRKQAAKLTNIGINSGSDLLT